VVSIPGACNASETASNSFPTLCEQKGIFNQGTCCCYYGSSSASTQTKEIVQTTQTAQANTDNAPKYKPLIFTPQIKIPILGSDLNKASTTVGSYDQTTGIMTSDLLAKYIKALYDYGLMIGGILATIVLMGGGILWLVSAGNDTKITQAKELIGGSVTGLVILFSSWVLLTTVNPELVNNKTIKTQVIKTASFNLGCCTNKATKIVSSETSASCKDNTFEPNKLADIASNSCVSSGCCVATIKKNDQTSTECQQEISTYCSGDGLLSNGSVSQIKSISRNYINQDCNTAPECNNATRVSCENKSKGDICGTAGHCYDNVCIQSVGIKTGDFCGTKGGQCTDQITLGACKSDNYHYDGGGRMCYNGLLCCYYKKTN